MTSLFTRIGAWFVDPPPDPPPQRLGDRAGRAEPSAQATRFLPPGTAAAPASTDAVAGAATARRPPTSRSSSARRPPTVAASTASASTDASRAPRPHRRPPTRRRTPRHPRAPRSSARRALSYRSPQRARASCGRARRATAALLCIWRPAAPQHIAPGAEPAPSPAGATTPGARRLAARLVAHDLLGDGMRPARLAVARARRRAAAADQVRRCLRIAGVPVVLAVAGPRPPAFEPLLAELDLAVAVLAAGHRRRRSASWRSRRFRPASAPSSRRSRPARRAGRRWPALPASARSREVEDEHPARAPRAAGARATHSARARMLTGAPVARPGRRAARRRAARGRPWRARARRRRTRAGGTRRRAARRRSRRARRRAGDARLLRPAVRAGAHPRPREPAPPREGRIRRARPCGSAPCRGSERRAERGGVVPRRRDDRARPRPRRRRAANRDRRAGDPRATRHAEAELAPPNGFGPAAFGSGGGYDGPLAYRQGKPMRPDVAQAFDRMAAAARARRRHARCQQRVPLRRRAGGAVRPPPGPEMGRAAGRSRCTATAPSSTSVRPPPTRGSRRTPGDSTSSCGTRGNRGISAHVKAIKSRDVTSIANHQATRRHRPLLSDRVAERQSAGDLSTATRTRPPTSSATPPSSGAAVVWLAPELDLSGGLPIEQRPSLRAAIEGVERDSTTASSSATSSA